MVMTSEPDDANDLVQDTILRALRYKNKFTQKTNFKSWIFTIMRNIFINKYRRQKKWQQIHEEDGKYLAEAFGNKNNQYADNLVQMHEIEEQIDSLNDDLKTTFTMYNEGYKYEEIADHLGIPIGTVKSRIFMARKKLMARIVR